LSASRAGLVSLLLFDAVVFWKYRKKALLVGIIGLILMGLSFAQELSFDTLSKFKIKNRLSKESFIESVQRRIEGRFELENVSIIFGKGKTNKIFGKKEVHNTFIDIIYSYGVIGGCIFMAFLFFYTKGCIHAKYYFSLLLTFLPISLAHNVIRYRLVWVLLALVISASVTIQDYSKKALADNEILN
jgi:hypothetical protein